MGGRGREINHLHANELILIFFQSPNSHHAPEPRLLGKGKRKTNVGQMSLEVELC